MKLLLCVLSACRENYKEEKNKKERKIRKNDYCDKKIKNNTFFLDKKYYLNNIFERDNVTTLTNNNI